MNDTPYDLSQFIAYEFQIVINEDELKEVNDINSLLDIIHERIISNKSGYTHGFLYERKILEKIELFLNTNIKPEDTPEKIIPKKDRIQIWEKMRKNLEIDLPALQYAPSIKNLFSFSALILTIGVLITCSILVAFELISGLIFLTAIFSFLLAFSLFHFTGSLRTYISFADFKILARGIFLLNKKNIPAQELLNDTVDLKGVIKKILIKNFSEERLKNEVFQS